MYWKAPIREPSFLLLLLCGSQLAEGRGHECRDAVVSPFYVAPINLRAFAPTVDVGLAPGEEQKASGLSGERFFWFATLRKGG